MFAASGPKSSYEPRNRLSKPWASGPELALEPLGGLLQRARVGAGREALPAAVTDDERDVGALVALARDPVGDRQGGVQDRAGRDSGEDALMLDEFAGAPQRVVGRHREPGGEHRVVVELGDEALV